MSRAIKKDALPGQWDMETLEEEIAKAPVASMEEAETALKRIKAAQSLLTAGDRDLIDQQAYVTQVLKALADLRNSVNYDIRLLVLHANNHLGMSAASLGRSANISDRSIPNWHKEGIEGYGEPDYSKYIESRD